MPDLLKDIDEEITRNNLKNERNRLDDALFNLEFYRGDFSRFPPRVQGTSYDAGRYPRCSLIMRRIVTTLSANLYAEGPARKLVSPPGMPTKSYESATTWLQTCYNRNKVDTLWQRADAYGAVSDVACFQVSATPDPNRPVGIQIWDASQFCVWTDPDMPTVPMAVAIIDLYNHQRRLRLYTAEVIRTYLSRRLDESLTSGGRDFKFQSELRNPYGFLPFSFAHFDYPTSDFWSGGPGCYLRSVNDGVNFALTEGFDCIRFNLRPIVVFKNVRAGWRPSSPVKPGDVWDLSAATDLTGENEVTPEATYLQADSAFVAAGWDDLQAYMDHVLEMCGVPPSTIRMTQESSRSGVAIIAEQLPIIGWAKQRQRPFSYYEDELARLVLRVGASHLGNQVGTEYKSSSRDLENVVEDPGLTLRWANLYPRIPGQEADQADQFRLDHGLVSRIMLLMERNQITREEAEELLETIAEDLKVEREMFGEAFPPSVQAMGTQEEKDTQQEAMVEAKASKNGDGDE